MQNRLNSSISIFDNTNIYNTFSSQKNKQEVFKYLSQLYQKDQANPVSFNERLKEMAGLPDKLLVYLLVEIKKMNEENGFSDFEKREPGCLKAFFSGLSFALQHLKDLSLSHEFIKKLHLINTDIQKVNMELMNESSSGQYRTSNEACLDLFFYDISLEGMTYLIELIAKGILPHLEIQVENNFRTKQLEQEELAFTFLADFLDYLVLHQNEEIYFQTVKKYFFEHKQFFIDEEGLIAVINYKDLIFRIGNELCKFLSGEEKFKAWDLLGNLRTILNREEIDDFIAELKQPFYSKTFPEVIKELRQSASDCLEKIKKNGNIRIKQSSLEIAKKHYNVNTNEELAIVLYEKIKTEKLGLSQFYGLESQKVMDGLLQQFNQELKVVKNKTADEKLAFIFKFTQLFLLAHPFADANNRTFVNQIANCLLISFGFPPAIYFHPFVFYAHSVPEIVTTVKLACANYLALIEHEKDNTLNYFHSYYKGVWDYMTIQNLKEMVKPLRDYFKAKNVTTSFTLFTPIQKSVKEVNGKGVKPKLSMTID